MEQRATLDNSAPSIALQHQSASIDDDFRQLDAACRKHASSVNERGLNDDSAHRRGEF